MLNVLEERFRKNMHLHEGLEWDEVKARLLKEPSALETLRRMEESGGEPDTIGFDKASEKLIYCDCSKESPAGRRSLCYDDEALRKRAKNPPKGSALSQAEEMGVNMMDGEIYMKLQELDAFDLKTSTWILTPKEIRDLGGALFCERRYGKVFTFHNGANSYYSVRGWRGYILI